MSRALVSAIRGLVPAGIATYDTDVTDANPPFPYVLVTAPGVNDRVQVTLGQARFIRDYVNVTCVGETVEQARWCMERVRPALDEATVELPGALAVMRFRHGQPVSVDRSVRLAGGAHPAYAVDLYAVVGQPVPHASPSV